MAEQEFKRQIAYKLKIGDILGASPMVDGERLRSIECYGKQVVRVNVIANIIDKFIQEGEKKFASITLDDASGQLKSKTFGDDVTKFLDMNQGDTVQIIGLVRMWNNEIYITPEIVTKKDPSYLLIRKYEIEQTYPKPAQIEESKQLRDTVLQLIKREDEKGGIESDKLSTSLNASPDMINTEIRKLLEEGVIYEPRPGKLRYLG